MFCANRLVFKCFQFSLEHFLLFIVFPISNLSQTHHVILKEPPFLHHFNSKSSRTRYGFSLSLYILHVLNLVYLNLWVVDLIWDIGCFRDGLDVCLLCLDFWVLLIRLSGFYFYFHGWYWLYVSIDPFAIWILYPLCYELFWYTVMHFMCIFGWFKMVVFRWLGYLFKLFMVIMCVVSVFWLFSTLWWFVLFILFMPYLIVICPILVKCVLHWVWGTFGSLQLINACVFPLELSCLRCCALWSLRSLCVMH